MNHLLKRGYANGFKAIEIQDGNIDLILHKENAASFYFYRFNPEHIFGERLDKQMMLVSEKQVSNFIQRFGKEYDGLINELIQIAIENKMTEKYDM